jgi:membrane-associated PAP2 superfamily phosphatase
MPVFLRHHRLLTGSAAAFVLLLAWDALGPDLALARLFGTPTGFPGRNSWLLSTLLHDRARDLGRLLVILLALAIWFPVGVLRQLSRAERAGLFAGTLLSLLAVSVVKNLSTTSCPWDLAEFGGVARHVSHWAWQVRDGGDGRCFPAGHASAGFAFVAGYFWLRGTAPAAARIWLSVALAAGLFLGLVQQVRGAHYMSHTLWTAWVCWVTSAAVWWAGQRVTAWRERRRALQA